jgi:hypothetical protein
MGVDDARRDDEVAGVVATLISPSSYGPMRVIVPSWMWIVAGRTSSGNTTRGFE